MSGFQLFRWLPGLLCAQLLSLGVCSGQGLDAGFEAANRLYEQGRCSDAAAAYEKLLESGHISAALHYNLGNACFKSAQIGKAIAAYSAARRIAPRDPDIRANLQFARNQVQGPTFAAPAWERALNRLSTDEWSLLAGLTVWVAFLGLSLPQLKPALKRPLRNYVAVTGLLAAVCCAVALLTWYQSRTGNRGIVQARDAIVRQGPLEESQTSFTLHDGAEVRILDQKDAWLQVTTDPRRIGWVKRDQIILLR